MVCDGLSRRGRWPALAQDHVAHAAGGLVRDHLRPPRPRTRRAIPAAPRSAAPPGRAPRPLASAHHPLELDPLSCCPQPGAVTSPGPRPMKSAPVAVSCTTSPRFGSLVVICRASEVLPSPGAPVTPLKNSTGFGPVQQAVRVAHLPRRASMLREQGDHLRHGHPRPPSAWRAARRPSPRRDRLAPVAGALRHGPGSTTV